MGGGEHVLLGDERAAAIELTATGQRGRPTEFVFPRVFSVNDLRESRSPFRLGPARLIYFENETTVRRYYNRLNVIADNRRLGYNITILFNAHTVIFFFTRLVR